ncbi:hypothetical protein FMUND_15040 [Fusarium mundagurra]|uniref:Clr5 domain-containing protein n=1 Tax=Fusarium mundagurra TaxID=1567541 RepID=A0A8H6D0E0_9HYPO|nr:hypothetical protein FMUND_15040 [Fusarium mundagurra]
MEPRGFNWALTDSAGLPDPQSRGVSPPDQRLWASTSDACANTKGVADTIQNSSLSNHRLNMPNLQFDLSIRQVSTPPDIPPTQVPMVPTASTKSTNKKRHVISESVWCYHRKTIEKLYIDDWQTLEDTMATMREKYQFVATKRMYKDRLKRWGLWKNLKKTRVESIVQEINDRQGRETEVLVEGRRVELDRVQRAHDRYSASENNGQAQCNAEIVVRTPEARDSSPSRGHRKQHTTTSSLLSFQLGSPAQGPLDVPSLRVDGRGLSEAELLTLRAKSISQVSGGNREEGISGLIAALCGFQNHFPATNPKVIETAWSLVQAYTLEGVSERCDEVISWMSTNYSRDLGLWHPLSLLHYIRVEEWLLSCGRIDEAQTLGLGVYVAVRDSVGDEGVITIKGAQGDDESTTEVPSMSVLEGVFADYQDDIRVGQQLKLAKLWSLSRLSGMDTILRRLIQRFDTVPGVFQIHSQDVRCMLIEFLIASGNSSAATEECKATRDSQAKLIKLLGKSEFKSLLRISRELSTLHLVNGDPGGHMRVLTWTADAFQAILSTTSLTGYNLDGIQSLLHFYIKVGEACYNRVFAKGEDFQGFQ